MCYCFLSAVFPVPVVVVVVVDLNYSRCRCCRLIKKYIKQIAFDLFVHRLANAKEMLLTYGDCTRDDVVML